MLARSRRVSGTSTSRTCGPPGLWGGPRYHLATYHGFWATRSGELATTTRTYEERSVLADCAAVMGSPPARIVAVWLIAVSTFGHGTAITEEVSDIALVDGPRRLSILG